MQEMISISCSHYLCLQERAKWALGNSLSLGFISPSKRGISGLFITWTHWSWTAKRVEEAEWGDTHTEVTLRDSCQERACRGAASCSPVPPRGWMCRSYRSCVCLMNRNEQISFCQGLSWAILQLKRKINCFCEIHFTLRFILQYLAISRLPQYYFKWN